MTEKTIAVLYLATGGYIKFWKDFYKSCEKHFLKKYKKTYFVFTDANKFKYIKNQNIRVIYREHLNWPLVTLLRYHEFIKVEQELKNFDYIFFFNANMEFVDDVNEEILPDESNDGLVMGLHPCFCYQHPDEYTYERNPNSTAFIPKGTMGHYVQGCLNGGTADAFLKLCRTCKENIQKDIDNNIEAVWHDESHLNKYVLDKKYKILLPNYLYPEEKWLPKTWYRTESFPKDIKIISRDKTKLKYGGLNNLRKS